MAYKPVLPPGLYNDTSGSPGGSTTQLQYNNAGSFGGISGWSTNGSTALTGAAGTTLAIGGATIGSNALAVTGTTLFNGAVTNAANGALSAPAQLLTGTWITGGSATTTKPHVLIEPTGTTTTNWSTSGTGLGINAASGFTGFLVEAQLNGAMRFAVLSTGRISTPSGVSVIPTIGGNNAIIIDADGSNVGRLFLNNTGRISFTGSVDAAASADLFINRKAAATLQLGLDAAGVTNQMFTAANRITSDGVGANLTIAAGNGRGAAGGTLILSTFTTAGASTAGTLTSRMTIDTAGAFAFPSTTPDVDVGLASTHSWTVTFNGTQYKIPLTAV